jgi:ATP-dependent RNA helicase RhlB
VDYEKQKHTLEQGADIIIATPGRLIDYVKQGVVSLHACEVCILDEADRMFDLGFIKDLRYLMRKLPRLEERQTLLFSATLSHRVLELAYEHMNEPEKVLIETETITAARVRQLLYFPAMEEKLPLLISLLSRTEDGRCMVFVNTKVWVERVARALEKAHYRVGVLSGDVPQKRRQSLLAKFQRGELEILVATDVAARGLHIDGVSHVFNFDLPFDAPDYVHRIGRTARLGAEGDAISFACELYAQGLPDIEAFIEQKIPTQAVTNDLLQALPRQPRAKLEGAESISDIYAEAKAMQPADKRGPKPGNGAQKPRSPRQGKPSHTNPRSERPQSTSTETNSAVERTPRKPRRPQREPINTFEPAPVLIKKVENPKPSALKRIGSHIKSWFTPSNSGH